MAAAYLYHIAQNHPFVDGNKRCAAIAAYVFLDVNGVDLNAEPQEFERITRRTAAGDMDKEQLSAWFRGRLRAR